MKISIIGAAGNIGSAIAFSLMQRALAHEIAMIDVAGDLLNQQAGDMQTAAYLSRVNIIQGGHEMLSNSEIVIVAAAKSQPKAKAVVRANMLNANLDIFRDIARAISSYCPMATVIQVSNPIEPLAHVIQHEAGLRPSQILGYSLNDTIRFKLMLRDHLGLSSNDTINAVVMGEHGKTKVPLFDYVYVNGQRTGINAETRRRIEDEDQTIFPQLEYLQQATGRTAAWTTALGVSDMVAALNAPRPMPFVCSAYLNGEYGHHDVFCGVPVKLGLGLLQEITQLVLSPETASALDYSVETIRRASTLAFERPRDNSFARF